MARAESGSVASIFPDFFHSRCIALIGATRAARLRIRVIQVLLGHAKLDNTAFYTKVATRTVRTVTSPLDKLGMFKVGEIAPDG